MEISNLLMYSSSFGISCFDLLYHTNKFVFEYFDLEVMLLIAPLSVLEIIQLLVEFLNTMILSAQTPRIGQHRAHLVCDDCQSRLHTVNAFAQYD